MDPVVTVAAGALRGTVTDGVVAFKGIPYAQPPFGALRFAAPAPVAGWSGVRDAGEFGATAPKPPYPAPIDALLPEPVIAGEDCLNLNVWTPDLDSSGLPVLVWIHGGAFVNGSGAVPAYDGSRFARDGVVCVTLNYRLGVDGFGLIDGVPANRGLLDQIAALSWVRENIAAFGGDPDRVTIAGESAGAMSVTSLLAMPRAAGLFRQAIAQSGAGHHVLSPNTAGRVLAELADRLGVPPTADGLASVPIAQLVAAQEALSAHIAANPDAQRWGEITANIMAFEPVIDPDTLPGRPIDLVEAGAGSDVTVLTGTNTDEHALFLVPSGVAGRTTTDVLRFVLAGLGADPDAALAAYRLGHPQASAGELFIATLTDWFFRVPAVRLAEARRNASARTFMYEFSWRSGAFGGQLGACHALEIPFVFDTLDHDGLPALTGERPPQALADEMHGAWVRFVATGEPGWPAYAADRAVQNFGADTALTHDPRAAELAVWAGVR